MNAPMNPEWYFGLSIMCVMLSFFFSGTETGILKLDPINLRQRASKGSTAATQLLFLLQHKEIVLASMLIGNNLVLVTFSALTTSYLSRQFEDTAALLSVAIVTPLLLIIGEILPKSLYLSYGTTILFVTVPVVTFFFYLFKPVAHIMIILPRILFSRKNANPSSEVTSRDEIHTLIRMGALSQEIAPEEQSMIHHLLEFREKRVRSVMIPLMDIATIHSEATIGEANEIIQASGASRIPVYRGREENIIGILEAIDLLRAHDHAASIQPFIQSPHIVPEQQKVIELLPVIWTGSEIAIVVDEYGVAVGIVTTEDLIEEIMGDIKDEFDLREQPKSTEMGEGRYIIDGKMPVGEFNERVSDRIPKGDYESVAGFLISRIQRIPSTGETVEINGMKFIILESNPRRVAKLMVQIPKTPVHLN